MKTNLYTVLDLVANETGPVWSAKNDEVALRQFTNLLKGDHVTSPGDFHLYCIGEYDTESITLVGDRRFIPVNTVEVSK